MRPYIDIAKYIGLSALILLLVGSLWVIFFNPIMSVFNVTAQTESVYFTTTNTNRSRLIFYGASINDYSQNIFQEYSGSFELKENVNVTIERIAHGDIIITLSKESGSDLSLGQLYDGYYGTQSNIKAKEYLEIVIDSVTQKVAAGYSFVFNIESDAKIGKSINRLNFGELPGILKTGEISILGRSPWISDYFEAGARKLHPGDQITFYGRDNREDPSVQPTIGIVVINEEPAMTISYRRSAFKAHIHKPGPRTADSGYEISVSFLDRLMHDKLFNGISILVGFSILILHFETFRMDTLTYKKTIKQIKSI